MTLHLVYLTQAVPSASFSEWLFIGGITFSLQHHEALPASMCLGSG
jgi:hypothetical protein